VRLNERLRSLVHQTELLAEGTDPVRIDRHGEEVPSSYAQAETRSATDTAARERAQQTLATARAQRDEVRARHADLPTIAEVDAAVASVEQLEHDAAFARGHRRQQQMQHQLAAARRQLAQLRRADREHAELYTAETAYLDAVEAVEQTTAQVELHDYHLTATGITREPFSGGTGAIPVTGLVEHLEPQPDWSTLAVRAE
ncbi:MAG TPA: hypothetical protein VFQ65_29840, partial [Kofleriaceae bacterium]|nr:hypothetical protein [Kofleriaceae bacterium]